jgi:hypothetical protein
MKKVALAACSCALAVLALTGCEPVEEAVSLVITPTQVEVTAPNSAVTLSASGLRDLSLPLAWSVENPALGNISPAFTGSNAVYVSTRIEGANMVTVRDQYGAEGHAVIVHNYTTATGGVAGTTLQLVADPGQVPVGQNTSFIRVETNVFSRAPYAWRVGDTTFGNVGETTGNTTTYTSFRQGVNAIYVTDADGRNGQISVEQL